MRNKINKLMQSELFYIPVYICMFISITSSVLFAIAMIYRITAMSSGWETISTGWVCMIGSSIIGSIALLIIVIASMFDKEFPKVTKISEKKNETD